MGQTWLLPITCVHFPLINASELIRSLPLRLILNLVCEDTRGFFLNHFTKFLHSSFLNLPPLHFTLKEYYIQCQKFCGKRTYFPSSYLPFLFTSILSKANQVTDINFWFVICNTYCKSTKSRKLQCAMFLEQLTIQQPPKQGNKTWTFTDVLQAFQVDTHIVKWH